MLGMKKFNLYFALLSVATDALLLWAAMYLAYYFRADGHQIYLWPLSSYFTFVLKFIPIWLLMLAYQGLYRLRNPLKGWTAVARIITAVLSVWGMILIYLYLSRSPESLVFPRLIIAYGTLLTVTFVLLGRSILDSFRKLLNSYGYGFIRTVVIAKSADDNFVVEVKKPVHNRLVQSVITQDFIAKLDEAAKGNRFEEVVVAWPDLDEKEVFKIIDWAESNFVSFAQIPTLLDVKATRVEPGVLAGSPVLYFQSSPLDGWGRVFKRLLDLIVVIPVLIICIPLFIILSLLVRISSPGPVIYRERRIGQDGGEIMVGKFRSMYSDWRERFPHVQDWAGDEKTDIRITPIGRILRKTNLDEIPQLWDVFVGRMSLVGPRPEQPKYVKQFAEEVPQYIKRHHVKVGLTGWAQINGLRGNTPIPERTKYDLYYIQNWSIWFDIRIILGTLLYMTRQLFSR